MQLVAQFRKYGIERFVATGLQCFLVTGYLAHDVTLAVAVSLQAGTLPSEPARNRLFELVEAVIDSLRIAAEPQAWFYR